MDTLQAIRERRSIRRYRPDPIPEEDLARIIEAGHLAPSAANRQPWRFILVTDPEERAALAQACRGQTWMADAACILVGVGLPDVSAKWYRVDVAIAMQNMILAAWSLGYGTCWIGAFDPDQVKQVCGIPEDADVVALTPIGVPAVSPDARSRKEIAEVFADGSFCEPWSR
jgi:nitroreductase